MGGRGRDEKKGEKMGVGVRRGKKRQGGECGFTEEVEGEKT